MASHANRGQNALDSKDYPAAITHFTSAINSTSGTVSPLWLLQRSTAYQRTGAHDLALKDAERAHHFAIARGRAEHIATAHFRRAVAYYGLGQYGNARQCLIWTRQVNEKERGLALWEAKVTADWERTGGDETECNRVTAVEKPALTEKEDIDEMFRQQAEKEGNKSKAKEKGKEAVREEPVAAVMKPANTTIDKIRVEWYQTAASLTIEILCKGIPKEDATVKFEPGQLLVKFPVLASNCDYEYNANPLYQYVHAEKCSFRITPHKLEITLVKQVEGLKWPEIYPDPETEPSTDSAYIFETTGGTDRSSLAPFEESVRAHAGNEGLEPLRAPPFQGGVDWDKALQEYDDEVEDGGDPMRGFFRRLYKDADPDAKRAMMKSYLESNGTTLNTSWEEVGMQTTETMAPEGMEVKNWQ
ncbi:Protein SGT1 [Lachnellula arida]|uniref:Protein SGT1 n=1 Tax=Lachnellula arida TaxID=1316785 RepID=A0A8T9B0U0_9HELO|nr:Protein SGT1 [Lachnellula arida]